MSSRTLEVDEGSLSQSTRPTLVKAPLKRFGSAAVLVVACEGVAEELEPHWLALHFSRRNMLRHRFKLSGFTQTTTAATDDGRPHGRESCSFTNAGSILLHGHGSTGPGTRTPSVAEEQAKRTSSFPNRFPLPDFARLRKCMRCRRAVSLRTLRMSRLGSFRIHEDTALLPCD